jgi:hypothetical protein
MIPVADIFNLVRSITEWPRFPSACKHPVLNFRFGAKPWVLHQDTLIERSVLNTHGHQLTTLGDAQEIPPILERLQIDPQHWSKNQV